MILSTPQNYAVAKVASPDQIQEVAEVYKAQFDILGQLAKDHAEGLITGQPYYNQLVAIYQTLSSIWSQIHTRVSESMTDSPQDWIITSQSSPGAKTNRFKLLDAAGRETVDGSGTIEKGLTFLRLKLYDPRAKHEVSTNAQRYSDVAYHGTEIRFDEQSPTQSGYQRALSITVVVPDDQTGIKISADSGHSSRTPGGSNSTESSFYDVHIRLEARNSSSTPLSPPRPKSLSGPIR